MQFLQEILHGRMAKVFSSDVRRYYLPTLFPNIVCSLSVNSTAKRKVHLHIFGSLRFSESGFWMLAHCSITRGTVTFLFYQKCEKCKNKQHIKTTLFVMSHKLQTNVLLPLICEWLHLCGSPCNHFVKQSISFSFSKGGWKQAAKYVVF